MFKLTTHTHTHTPVLCLCNRLENSDLQKSSKPQAEFTAVNSVWGFLRFLSFPLWLPAVPDTSTPSLPDRAEACLFAPCRTLPPSALCVLLLLAFKHLFNGTGLFVCAVLGGLAFAHQDSFSTQDGAFPLLPRRGGLNACFLTSYAEGAFPKFMHCLNHISRKTKENKWHGTESRNGTSPGMGWT